ncbi:MAG: hypothetical protein MJ188_04610 [Treponema sp.]|nr:hypothetical protein [Treponema sp.]
MDITVKNFVEELWQLKIQATENQTGKKTANQTENQNFAHQNYVHQKSLPPNSTNVPENMDLLHWGHLRGWLEDQDEVEKNAPLLRRSAARIIHQFMKLELFIPDVEDISPANQLQDLYTCRVCVNHVAQVYLQNLMAPEEIDFQGHTALIFNMLGTVPLQEAQSIIKKLRLLQKQNNFPE